MFRLRVEVFGLHDEVLHDTVKVYTSKNLSNLHSRLLRNMMRKYYGRWEYIEVSFAK